MGNELIEIGKIDFKEFPSFLKFLIGEDLKKDLTDCQEGKITIIISKGIMYKKYREIEK